MSNIDEEKRALRSQIRILKKALPEEERMARSKRVLAQVEQLPPFQDAAIVMLYWSMNDELFSHDFVSYCADKKMVILPCVAGDELLLRQFTKREDMREGESFSILEPTGALFEDPKKIDLIVVPGVAFDKNNNRMGRGKGFYDKLLKETTAFKIGVCFDFQLLENIPTDLHDVKMDLVVSG